NCVFFHCPKCPIQEHCNLLLRWLPQPMTAVSEWVTNGVRGQVAQPSVRSPRVGCCSSSIFCRNVTLDRGQRRRENTPVNSCTPRRWHLGAIPRGPRRAWLPRLVS